MAIVLSKLNSPFDSLVLGQSPDGRRLVMCFFVMTFNTTAVGGIGGTTYDPSGHVTTNLQRAAVSGSDLFSLWGIRKVHRIVFSNGSSDAQVVAPSAATTNTGEVKAEYVESGNYIKLKTIGCGSDATLSYTVNEEEIDGTAANMSALRFTGFLIGS